MAVLVAVVMMLVMLTMTAADSYRAMHCISVFGGASCYVFMANLQIGTIQGPVPSLKPLVSHLT